MRGRARGYSDTVKVKTTKTGGVTTLTEAGVAMSGNAESKLVT